MDRNSSNPEINRFLFHNDADDEMTTDEDESQESTADLPQNLIPPENLTEATQRTVRPVIGLARNTIRQQIERAEDELQGLLYNRFLITEALQLFLRAGAGTDTRRLIPSSSEDADGSQNDLDSASSDDERQRTPPAPRNR